MGKLIKLFVVVAFVGGLLGAGSYAGARASAGRFVGSPTPPMGERTVQLAWNGIAEIPAHPRGWEFRYTKVEPNGNKPAKIFVSLDGKIIGTVPRDLERRLESWRQSKEIR